MKDKFEDKVIVDRSDELGIKMYHINMGKHQVLHVTYDTDLEYIFYSFVVNGKVVKRDILKECKDEH